MGPMKSGRKGGGKTGNFNFANVRNEAGGEKTFFIFYGLKKEEP
jgi:hypothetical protein